MNRYGNPIKVPTYFEHNLNDVPKQRDMLIDYPELYDPTDNHWVGRAEQKLWAGYKPENRQDNFISGAIATVIALMVTVCLYAIVWQWAN